ncbi:MAG: hypothetical protein R3B89_34845 [Polyangiaceae bacterium]
MAAKSETRRVLELMSMDDLREAIDHYDLQRARSHDESVSRLVRKIGSSLDALVSNEGPFSLGVWQDLVEDHLNGWSRDSWAELREEIRFCLEHPDLVELRNEVGEFSVSEVRANPEALILAAQVFDCQPEKLLSALGGRHGNTLLINIDDELRREVRRRKPRAPKNAEKNIPAVTKTVPQPVVSPAVETVPLFPQVPPTVGVLPTAGETINGRWELDKLLGHGGFGLAFSARDSYVPDVPVVLKFGRDDEGRSRWRMSTRKRVICGTRTFVATCTSISRPGMGHSSSWTTRAAHSKSAVVNRYLGSAPSRYSGTPQRAWIICTAKTLFTAILALATSCSTTTTSPRSPTSGSPPTFALSVEPMVDTPESQPTIEEQTRGSRPPKH